MTQNKTFEYKDRFHLKQLYRIPIAGYLFKLLIALITLPKKIEWINKIEKSLDSKAGIEQINKIEKSLDSKAGIEQITKIEKSLDSKAGNEQITKIEKSLDSKADIEQITKIEKSLDSKADIEQITKIEKSLDSKADKLNIRLGEVYVENISSFISEALNNLPKPFKDYEGSNKDDLKYLLFENVFRGHFNIIKERQKRYLPFIKNIKMPLNMSWLDIGCGRGEFLEILKNENIKSKGVEINTVEYEELIDKGYEVYNDNAVSFLEETKENFIGISAFQVVEHLEDNYLHKMIELSFLKIKSGGLIILETVNPYSLASLANFYLDETHKKPIPPNRLAFLLEWYGFKNVKIIYSALLPENYRNIDVQYNYQDFAVIGEKL